MIPEKNKNRDQGQDQDQDQDQALIAFTRNNGPGIILYIQIITQT